MLWLIADAGATKVEWGIWEDKEKLKAHFTQGLSPQTQKPQQIDSILQEELVPHVEADRVEHIWYYGAGASTPANVDRMVDALRKFFPNAQLEVGHDLTGAAIGLCGDQPGIASILGTGSNSCVWDGEKIVAHVNSLGYILGDEGSGAWFGKRLLADFNYGKMPEDVAQYLRERQGLTWQKILLHIYHRPDPNRWLASFVKVAMDFDPEHPYFQQIFRESFTAFFENHISAYQEFKHLPVNVVGGIGFNNQTVLKEVANSFGFSLGIVLQSPMKGMEAYHLKHL